MVRYWVEWIDHGTNDKHSTDLHDTEEEALKAAPRWRAYRESVKVYQTTCKETEFFATGISDAKKMDKSDDKVS
jgi:hypothetical protein